MFCIFTACTFMPSNFVHLFHVLQFHVQHFQRPRWPGGGANDRTQCHGVVSGFQTNETITCRDGLKRSRDKSATSPFASFWWNLGTSTTRRQTDFGTSRTCHGEKRWSRRLPRVLSRWCHGLVADITGNWRNVIWALSRWSPTGQTLNALSLCYSTSHNLH